VLATENSVNIIFFYFNSMWTNLFCKTKLVFNIKKHLYVFKLENCALKSGMLTRTQASRPRTGPRTRSSRPRPKPRTQGQCQDQGLDLQGQGQDQGPDQGLIITRTNSILNTRNLTVTYTFVILQFVKAAKKNTKPLYLLHISSI